MPNDCYNRLIIKTTNKDKVAEILNKYFYKKSEDNYLVDFNKIIPEPKTKAECPKEYIITEKERVEKIHIAADTDRPWFNWYDWHLVFWGTKWNSYHTFIDVSKDEMYITFDTAWTPAENIIVKLMELEPDIDIEYVYYEPGMGFAGCIYREDGIVTSEEHNPLDLDDPDDQQWLVDNDLESEEYFIERSLDELEYQLQEKGYIDIPETK